MLFNRGIAIRLLPLVTLVAGAGSSARASVIQLLVSSTGTVTAVQNGLGGQETVKAQQGGAGAFSALSYTIDTQSAVNGVISGIGDYSGSSGSLDFTFSYNQTDVLSANNGASQAVDATVDFVPSLSTGSYAGVTGSGTLDLNFLVPSSSSTSGLSTTLVSAVLNTPQASGQVPSPAPGVACAALVGLMSLGRWSRRKSTT